MNKRNLPWRETREPYLIWLSEIILQQTRVDQGMAYYERFITHYPDVQDLASATEEEVLKDWQGLGYYSRARNLHHTALAIVTDHKGKFPASHKELLRLKGIGKYTASAIASFCFDLPHAVIDGNVYRVLSRIFGIEAATDTPQGQRIFEETAAQLLDKNRPGEHNQAVMEFGALYCKPQNPDCQNCIFAPECVARKQGKVHSLPVKLKKVKQRERYFNYLVIRIKGHTYLRKRTASDIWKNMYDFPLIENDKKLSKKHIVESDEWKRIFNSSEVVVQRVSTAKPHLLTHQKINATFWEIRSDKIQISDKEEFIKIKESDIQRFPVPKLIENYLDQ